VERANTALALKAEVVLAWQLVTRHRAPRFGLLLAMTMIGLWLMDRDQHAELDRRRTMLLMAGILASVTGSRVLSRGAVLSSARRTTAPTWAAPVGRLGGALMVAALPIGIAAGILDLSPSRGTFEPALLPSVLIYMAAIASWVMAITPVAGASSGAAFGLVASFAGTVSPSDLFGFFARWPMVGRWSVMTWGFLPLAWRVNRATDQIALPELLILVAWTIAGLGVAGWLVGRRPQAPARRNDA
jgi:hypothetical protein